MEDWARRVGLHRLELTVMPHNERAIALYQKRGFSIEGEISHSLYIDGEYVDEFLMAKIVDGEITKQSHARDVLPHYE
jgi:RimJ/RimL family protein N-acetyltransferase